MTKENSQYNNYYISLVIAARKAIGSLADHNQLMYVHPEVLRSRGIDPKPFCNKDGVVVIPHILELKKD